MLKDVPIDVPPTGTVYHAIKFAPVVALRFVVTAVFVQNEEGFANTWVGFAGAMHCERPSNPAKLASEIRSSVFFIIGLTLMKNVSINITLKVQFYSGSAEVFLSLS